jgi:hypothetical protein
MFALGLSICAISCAATASQGPTITFDPPSLVGESYDMAGFQGIDDSHALGVIEDGGWMGTADGGKSWQEVFGRSGTLHCTGWPTSKGTDEERCLNGNKLKDGFNYFYNSNRGTSSAVCGATANCWCCKCPSSGPCTAPTHNTNFSGGVKASVKTSENSRHDLGTCGSVPDKGKAYTEFSSTSSTVFSLSNATGFSATTTNRSVVFRGIPSPGFSCGNARHAFGCPFRTGGRGYVKLPDGTLVMSIIVWWGGAHANPNAKLAAEATSVVAFRSSDDGYTWQFSGSILDASAAPESEEGAVYTVGLQQCGWHRALTAPPPHSSPPRCHPAPAPCNL